MTLRFYVTGVASTSKVQVNHHFAQLFEQYRTDTGLDTYDARSDVPAGERLQVAISGAMQRYATSSEHDRCDDPVTTIRLLTRAVLHGVGNAGITHSPELAALLPDLQPLQPLSPVIEIVHKVVLGLKARLAGRRLCTT